MVPCRGRARRHHRRPACFHRERRQRRQWRPALLRVRGAAGVSGNPQEAAIAAAVAGFADAHPRRPRSGPDLLGRAIPARLPAGGGARDHCSAARARRLEPERTGAAFPKLDAFVRTANRRQACGVPQQEGIRRGAPHDHREDWRGRPAGVDAGRMPGAGACAPTRHRRTRRRHLHGLRTGRRLRGVLCGAYVPPETATQCRMVARRGSDRSGSLRRPACRGRHRQGTCAGGPLRSVHGSGIERICESVRVLSADLSAQGLQHHPDTPARYARS